MVLITRLQTPVLACLAFTVLILAWPSKTRAEDYAYASFERAKNAYDAGEYKEAASRFDVLLKEGQKNPALLFECHKFIAVSYLFVGDKEKAEHHFNELLNIAPDYSLDPMIFPIEVVDFFLEVKQKNKKQLEALAIARAEEEKIRKKEEEKKQQSEFEKLRRNVYLQRTSQKNSLIVAFIPFGAGQFQNGDKIKGALFLSGELFLTAAAITTYFLHDGLRRDAKTPFESPEKREDAERLEIGYRIANQASFVALGIVAVTGIVEALVRYQPEITVWKRVQEREVPKNLRPGKSKINASIAPSFSLNTIGLGVTAQF